jgi:ATP-dependent protease ClpP protease subunit
MKNIMQLYKDNAAHAKQPVNLVRNESGAVLYIYGIISPDYGISALDVAAALAQAGEAQSLTVHINSPGGQVFESRAIMSAIQAFAGKTTAVIDGVCASAATSIALACNEVEMADHGLFMIHNAMGMAFGDKTAMRDTADLLEKVEVAIVAQYAEKTGKDAVELLAMMDAETWFSADEALAHGFIDRITTAKEKPKNQWNLSAYAHAPQAFMAAPDAVPPHPVVPDPAPSMRQANTNKLALATVL